MLLPQPSPPEVFVFDAKIFMASRRKREREPRATAAAIRLFDYWPFASHTRTRKTWSNKHTLLLAHI